MKRTFIQFLIETPVNDYETIGNFNKSSSFRHETDRRMVTSEKAIKNVRKKFGKCPYGFNLYFVNSPKANRHTQVGEVSIDWIKQNLDVELVNKLAQTKNALDDNINIVFTNNKGDERVPMTPWIMAHRFAHAVARRNGMRPSHNAYTEAEKHLQNATISLMDYYGKKNFDMEVRGYRADRENVIARRNQLAMIYLFNQLGKFKSARERKLRDWFEITNELIAQYIITGNISFNDPPQCFGGGARASAQRFCADSEEMEDLTNLVHTIARDMDYYIDQILSSAVGNIYVM